jgi:hypothetical protein
MNIFNEDFKDFITVLNKFAVEYMLVGGYAVILRGYSRSTGDMDIWINKTEHNYQQLLLAITEFGLPAAAVPINQFFSTDYDVFSFGKPPFAIELMTEVKGLEFIPAYQQSTIEKVDELSVRVIHLNQLIDAKKAAGRNKDLNDIDNLPPRDGE